MSFDGATYVTADGREWSSIVRAGLRAATGDQLVVLDIGRHYSPESLTDVIAPVRTGRCDVAVAVPSHDGPELSAVGTRRLRVFRLISRLILGTSDVFSGLFALDRSVWERAGSDRALGKSPVLDSLLRRPARCIDVKVSVDDRFQSRQVRFSDLRPLKHVLDSRFGNYSRLVQFCMVGASGMVVDLTFYAFLQWLLSFTALASHKSALFGGTWHLVVAAALAIAIALVWNFTSEPAIDLQRRTQGLDRASVPHVRAFQCAGDRAELFRQTLSAVADRVFRPPPPGGGRRGDRRSHGNQLHDGPLARLRPAVRKPCAHPSHDLHVR